MIETCALIDVVDFVDKARPSIFFSDDHSKKKVANLLFFSADEIVYGRSKLTRVSTKLNLLM